jgi:ribosomal protein L16 Arg81 hydroxylase
VATLDRRLQEWMADCLIQGVSASRIADSMAEHDFDRDYVLAQIREFEASPVLAAARTEAQRRIKMASLFEAFSELNRQANLQETREGAQTLSPDAFYSDYFYRNRPVLVDGLMAEWPALNLWSPQYFAEQFGDIEVEIAANRNQDTRYEDNFAEHRLKVPMGDFIRMIEEGGETNDYYLVAKNKLLEQPEWHVLMSHFWSPHGFLDPAITVEGYVKLWLGPKGTVTPLHHDATNIFFGQVFGRKHVKLISPFDLDHVYNDRTCFSAVDPECIDYDRFPLMKRVPILDVVVEPGQFLFIPLGWWHWVKSLDVSISLSFQNFYFTDSSIVWHRCY